jgi:hypothetical protein
MNQRTVLYIVGAGALWYLLTNRQTAGRRTPNAAAPELVTFPPITPVDLDDLFCSPTATYGGWKESSKVAEAERLYLQKWGFSATPEFIGAVKQRNPCEPRHIQVIVDAYPPFPGQTFRKSELADIAKRQKEGRDTAQRQAEAATKRCVDSVTGGAAVVGTVTGGILAGVGTLGVGVAAGAGAGGAAGGSLGRFLSGVWC